MNGVLGKLEPAGMEKYAPKLAEKKTAEFLDGQPNGPKKKLNHEKPAGKTIDYDLLLQQQWKAGAEGA